MNLVRKIKISKLISVEFTEIETEIIEFINSKLSDLIPYKYTNLPKSMFYMSPAGKWLLEQDDSDNILRVRYEDFWNVLQSKYWMEQEDIENLLKYMVEQSFKSKVSKPSFLKDFSNEFSEVEDAFKKQVSTPKEWYTIKKTNVEVAFENELNKKT